MTTASSLSLAALLAAACLALAACSKKADDTPTPTPAGTVTWTHNGTTYTSTLSASAIVGADTSLLVTGSSEDGRTIVSLRLKRIYRTGAGVYPLRRGSVVNGYSSANILLGGSTGASYATLYGPSATNGSITVSQYDRAAQKASGTFSYTAGAIPNTTAAGSQGVTNGSFTFTRFQ